MLLMECLMVGYLVGDKRMGFLLAMGLHQLFVTHDFPWLPIGNDSTLIYQNDALAYLQDKLKVVRSDQHGLV